MGAIEEQKKKWKLTEDEYKSLPSYISIYAEQGDTLPVSWMTDFRKKSPAQPTRADSTFRPLTDKYGVPTGGKIGFNINEPVDRRALRTFEKQESAKLGTKPGEKPPKDAEEAYRRKISGFTGEIGELSQTAKRLEEIGIEPEVITQQISALSDSIRIASKEFKTIKTTQAKKALLAGTKKFTVKEKQTAEIVRTNINRSLRTGVPIDRIRELIQDNWGMTLEEFNTIYKNNQ